MLISNKHRFIFVHIYKTAGTSVTNVLEPLAIGPLQRQLLRGRAFLVSQGIGRQLLRRRYHKHITAREVVDIMGREKFDDYFSFAFVRNPWDWQVSLYKYILKDTRHYLHDFVRTLPDFDAFIRWRCLEEIKTSDSMIGTTEGFKFQKDFVFSASGECLVDFVGRFENLTHDFNYVCEKIGSPKRDLPRLNVSNKESYTRFYSEETRDLVGETFRPDIEAFGYRFCA